MCGQKVLACGESASRKSAPSAGRCASSQPTKWRWPPTRTLARVHWPAHESAGKPSSLRLPIAGNRAPVSTPCMTSSKITEGAPKSPASPKRPAHRLQSAGGRSKRMRAVPTRGLPWFAGKSLAMIAHNVRTQVGNFARFPRTKSSGDVGARCPSSLPIENAARYQMPRDSRASRSGSGYSMRGQGSSFGNSSRAESASSHSASSDSELNSAPPSRPLRSLEMSFRARPCVRRCPLRPLRARSR